jgi:uncharacterized sulfatase
VGLHVPLVVRIPQNFRHLVKRKPGQKTDRFVSFIDFGPTVLNLAGVPVPQQVDGEPFLGPGGAEDRRSDEAFGYADRFDEKYDLCRSLRKGKWKYVRNYQAFYPDGLQNNYRYRMVAYREWRDLYRKGTLNAVQRRFFEGKPVEALYDLEADPDETRTLAGEPAYAETLADMRSRLQQRVKGMPDLSFFPESYLVEHALADGVAFGQENREAIGQLVDIADLSLKPFAEARSGIETALRSGDPWGRYWALIVCSCFGKKAESLASGARKLLADDVPLVRVRAAEFLAILGTADPWPTIVDVLNASQSEAEALLTLNTVVYLNDHVDGLRFDVTRLNMKLKPRGEVKRRLDYLRSL